MKAYCGNCEKKVDPAAKLCPYCHEDLTKNRHLERESGDVIKETVKKIHYLWALIGFAFPLSGLVAYFIIRDDGTPVERPVFIGSIAYLGILVFAMLVTSVIDLGYSVSFITGDMILLVIFNLLF